MFRPRRPHATSDKLPDKPRSIYREIGQMRPCVQTIRRITGEYVKVEVRHGLLSIDPTRVQEVDAGGPDSSHPHSDFARGRGALPKEARLKIPDGAGVPPRSDYHVCGRLQSERQEGHDVVIFVDEICLCLARRDAAEDATHDWHRPSIPGIEASDD